MESMSLFKRKFTDNNHAFLIRRNSFKNGNYYCLFNNAENYNDPYTQYNLYNISKPQYHNTLFYQANSYRGLTISREIFYSCEDAHEKMSEYGYYLRKDIIDTVKYE